MCVYTISSCHWVLNFVQNVTSRTCRRGRRNSEFLFLALLGVIFSVNFCDGNSLVFRKFPVSFISLVSGVSRRMFVVPISLFRNLLPVREFFHLI